MNKTLLALLAGATLSLTTGTAQAGGMVAPGPSDVSFKDAPVGDPCCTTNWRGFYAAAGIGVGSVTHEYDLDVNFPGFALAAEFNGLGGEGFFGTVQIGFDTMLSPNIVVGVFADWDMSEIESELTIAGGVLGANLEHDYTLSVGARVGYTSGCCTLWYGSIGYSHIEFENLNALVSLPYPDFGAIFFGLGAETRLVGNFYLKGEYRYTHGFDEDLLNVGFLGGNVTLTDEPSFHTGRASLVYRFGG